MDQESIRLAEEGVGCVPRIFLINVGANASHGALRSPIFADGCFKFVPIPDGQEFTHLPRYVDIHAPRRGDLRTYIPKTCIESRAHNDPEFETFTYGDYPTHSPRAANLKRIRPGDCLFFLARLTRWEDDHFTDDAGFYLIGYFCISAIFRNINEKPAAGVLRNIGKNAHVLRGLSDALLWDDFWVFKGSRESRLFKRAVRFDKNFAVQVMKSASGEPWVWERDKTDLQTIGSYTRSCRILADKTQIEQFRKTVDEQQRENERRICSASCAMFS